MKALSVYIHIPFCVTRCRYCDFVSYLWQDRFQVLSYLAFLYQELCLRVERYALAGRTVETVYFGGGTPSLLEPEAIAWVLRAMKEYFSFSPRAEITLEMRPQEGDERKIGDFRGVGVNRLSVGVQSFTPEYLLFLGRDTPKEVLWKTLHETRGHFRYWSMDLIYGLPLQDLSRWQRDLEQALTFAPPHLSVYNLTLHSQSPLFWFFRCHKRLFPSVENESVLWEWTMVRLREAGYRQYEISNFAQPGDECRHNLRYWSDQEYLGLGVSAWSYLKGVRERNTNSLKRYVQALEKHTLPIAFREELPPFRRLGEVMVMGLRKGEGLAMEDLEGYPPSMVAEKLKTVKRLVQEGWLDHSAGRYVLTPRGIVLANQVLAELID
ncbi:MAG: radical SAM family heme chaperone HemW [Atribacterota bacterium]